jgi:acyl carrier protein
MGVLATLAVVLGRVGGQRDVVVGVPISGRGAAGTEDLIGVFVNTLPLRVHLDDDLTFTELARQVRVVATEAYAHADAPLDVLVRELTEGRDPQRTPLFQVILNAVDDPGGDRMGDVTSEPLDAPVQPAKFDVALTMQPAAEGRLVLDLEFRADRHDPALMRLLVDALGRLLRLLPQQPDQPLANIPLTGDGAVDLTPPAPHPTAPGTTDRVAGPAGWASPAAGLPGAGTAVQTLPSSAVGDPVRLAGLLREDGITVAHLTPSMLRSLATTAAGRLPCLRALVLDHDGDLTTPDLITARTLAPDAAVVAVHHGRSGQALSAHAVDGSPSGLTPLRVPLGTGLPGRPLRLLIGGRAAGAGEVAEIHTADAGATGDLGRLLPDGLVHLTVRAGRDPLDDLLEVETALRAAPGVIDAIVDDDGRSAWVAAPGRGAEGDTLRQQLLGLLPGWRVPATVTVLDALPLGADGRVDRVRLPVPDGDPDGAPTGPRTPAEERLVAIVSDLLGVEQVDVHGSFFQLGGFSLLATQLVARVHEEFGVELTLQEVFGAPTVEGLARRLLQQQAATADAALVAALLDEIDPGATAGPTGHS